MGCCGSTIIEDVNDKEIDGELESDSENKNNKTSNELKMTKLAVNSESTTEYKRNNKTNKNTDVTIKLHNLSMSNDTMNKFVTIGDTTPVDDGNDRDPSIEVKYSDNDNNDTNDDIKNETIKEEVNKIYQNMKYAFIEGNAATLAGSKNGKQKTNQDMYFMFDNFGDFDDNIMQYYGVCDGHGPDGHKISKW
eukprot:CAMPEP_0114657286 /NCGR_PEP_ID=MMETSP0191-20121206/13635_1 /TAXON_ID=126664 /ORGANISM="Sorites sp." /LENGTH=191 /DNA_ID=CAMNT_0001876235 /DNA_START=29 /DNA_END=601 /DNA_ORIENTATION=+